MRAAPAARVRARPAVHADLTLHSVDRAAYWRVHARQVEARQRRATRDNALALSAPRGALGALAARQRAVVLSKASSPAQVCLNVRYMP